MKIRQIGAELLYADTWTDGRSNRWTDMTKLIVAFRNFANEPKNVYKQTGAFRKQQHCYFKTVKKCP